ncbi:MFS transporter [Pectobacterium aroidearum]|uniref:MFS transporter n=1 Tax=Pectobacterium aroidearum TaxID=1201031 RepID=UPI002A83A620|nr:MFS transporter [Pectobacterium aroidearum]
MMTRAHEFTPVSRLGLTAIVTLYLAHALPLYFYNVAMPSILRSQGVDLRWIGMLSLLYLPWACKFLWAPLIDRYYLPALGRRRTWLWLTQIALATGVLVLAFTGLDYGLLPFVLIGLWISTWAATQDIAIDGYTVESLAESDHRLGSMAQSIGVALGSMIGGAGILLLYQLYGWRSALLSLAVLTALTMIAVTWINERPQTSPTSERPSFANTFRRREIRWALLLILLYRLVEAPAMAMLTPLLVDQQWTLVEIGLLMSVAGAGIGLLSAITTAWALKRYSSDVLLVRAGWLRSGVYLLLAALLYSGSTMTSGFWLGTLAIVMLAIRYMAMTSLYALFMRLCSRRQAGTDFTVLVCFELLVFFLGGSLSGFLAAGLGYGAYYLLLGVLSLLSVLLCRPLIRKHLTKTI